MVHRPCRAKENPHISVPDAAIPVSSSDGDYARFVGRIRDIVSRGVLVVLIDGKPTEEKPGDRRDVHRFFPKRYATEMRRVCLQSAEGFLGRPPFRGASSGRTHAPQCSANRSTFNYETHGGLCARWRDAGENLLDDLPIAVWLAFEDDEVAAFRGDFSSGGDVG